MPNQLHNRAERRAIERGKGFSENRQWYLNDVEFTAARAGIWGEIDRAENEALKDWHNGQWHRDRIAAFWIEELN